MRIVRAGIALLVAVLLGSSSLSTVAANATDSSLPVRVITSDTTAKTFKSFKLTGNVEAYPSGKVIVQKKKCNTCKFKTINKITTTAYGNFRTTIVAPLKGKWKYRAKVNAQGGYAASYSKVWAIFVK